MVLRGTVPKDQPPTNDCWTAALPGLGSHTDPWRVLRIQAEFVEGFRGQANVGPAISVFGSARAPRDHPEYATAEDVGARLVGAGCAVITGGGPSIMEANNRAPPKPAGPASAWVSSRRSRRASTSGWRSE